MTKIAILGYGYLGVALGRQLIDSGHTVVGVRRSGSKRNTRDRPGLTLVQADVTDPASLSHIPDVESIVFMVSSGNSEVSNARDTYETGIATVLDHFADRTTPPSRFVYTSSTGVYGDHDGGWVDESVSLSPETDRQRTLMTAEQLTRTKSTDHDVQWTILRLGGIYGPDRYRIDQYLEGPVSAGVLNLVHRTDAARVIKFLLEEGLACDEIVNVVDNEPVSKWELADWLASVRNEPAPSKQTLEDRLAHENVSAERAHRITATKRCSNAKLRGYGFQFTYPSFREGYRDAFERCTG